MQRGREEVGEGCAAASAAVAGEKEEKVTAEEISRLVTDATRLFLMNDWSKKPVKREDLSKVVLKNYPANKFRKLAATVIEGARKRLREVFGFELVVLRKPLPTSAKGKRGAASQQAKTTYALVNALGPDAAERPPLDDQSAAARFGLLNAILGVVILASGTIPEESLLAQLRKIGIETPKDAVFGDVEELLETFVRQQYLAKRKMSRSAEGAEDDGRVSHEFLMGPRSVAEFDRRSVLGFVAHAFGQEIDPELVDMVLSTQCPSSLEPPLPVSPAPPATTAAAAPPPQAASSQQQQQHQDSLPASSQAAPSQPQRRRHPRAK